MERNSLDEVKTPEALSRALEDRYLPSLGIERPPHFYSGEIVRVLAPAQVATRGIVILGAYPTARFQTIDRHIVPVGNIAEPFDPGTASGKELEEHYLEPLRISRCQCWITNLVKVFLFKSDHRRPTDSGDRQLAREDFEHLACLEANREWLAAELRIAAPKLIITLGREVAGIMRGVSGDRERNKLLSGSIDEHEFAGSTYHWIHLPHPGIVMRTGDERNKWPDRQREFCNALAGPIRSFLAS